MKTLIIEVAPRLGQDLKYHASQRDRVGAFGSGNSPEEAIRSFIATSHAELGLTTTELETAQQNPNKTTEDESPWLSTRGSLKNLLKLLSDRGFEFDVRFMLLEYR
jgi:hypothetical protein